MRAIPGLAVETVARGNSLCRAAGDGQYVQLPQQIKDDGLAVRRHVEGHPRTLVRVKFDSPG